MDVWMYVCVYHEGWIDVCVYVGSRYLIALSTISSISVFDVSQSSAPYRDSTTPPAPLTAPFTHTQAHIHIHTYTHTHTHTHKHTHTHTYIYICITHTYTHTRTRRYIDFLPLSFSSLKHGSMHITPHAALSLSLCPSLSHTHTHSLSL
jgi:hypothetical protein